MTIARDGDALVRSPPADARLFLFHGPDGDAARELARALETRLGGDRIEFDPRDLVREPGRLADEACAVSMFGDRQVLAVRGIGDAALEAIELLLAAPPGGHPAVLVAGDLKKTSPLRKLAEAHPAARAVACYPPDARAFLLLAREGARARGIDADNDALALIAAAAGGERGVLARELDKLATYLDARPDRRARLDPGVARAVGAGEGSADIGPLVDAVAARAGADAARALGALAADGVSGIPLVRAVARRLAQVAEARAAVDAGATPAATVKALRPPVFWKEEGAVVAAVARWRSPELATAQSRLLAAERAVKAPASVGDLAAAAALLTMAAD